MIMKTTVLNSSRVASIVAALATVLALPAQADGMPGRGFDQHDGFRDRARVISTTPIYETVNEPKRSCWIETLGHNEYMRQDRSYGGAIIGSVVGGLLGSQFGKGNGKVAAAAVGAATGAMVGDNVGNDRHAHGPSQVERCSVQDNYRQVLSGYNVSYEYGGKTFATTLPYDPGRFLDVRVNVAVAERQAPERTSQWGGSPWSRY
jgi:uncharacterized protein YcfJ